jgi:nitrogen fixation protein NifU and related proteins
MNEDLRELYEEVILDHNRNPRNFNRTPVDTNHSAHGDNPLCGDRYSVNLKVKDGRVDDVGFEGSGCAISKASASLMLESIKGKSLEEIDKLFNSVHHHLTEKEDENDSTENLGKLKVLGGVREFPVRVKCATLPWHILKAAIHETDDNISTE